MKKFLVTIKTELIIDHKINAISIDDALNKVRSIDPTELLKTKKPSKGSVVDCNIIDIEGIFEF